MSLAIGSLFVERGDDARTVRYFRAWRHRYASAALPHQVMRAELAMGRALLSRREGNAAQLAFSAVLELWAGGVESAYQGRDDVERRVGLSEAREAAAEAAFHEADVLYQRFRDAALPTYRGRGDLTSVTHWSQASFQPWLEERLRLLAQAEVAYDRVASFDVARWAIAAAARAGEMYVSFADAFATAPVPREIERDPLAYEAYVDELERERSRFFEPAVDRYTFCLEAATRLRFFDDRAARCARELHRLAPREHPLAAELTAPPTWTPAAVPPRAADLANETDDET